MPQISAKTSADSTTKYLPKLGVRIFKISKNERKKTRRFIKNNAR